ncbi:MAG: hypothetical protein U5L45_12470 [Saprospiraceae bacterium]|nr:hypothetical protein [Saprospiraceae bacterium]
MKRKNLSLQVYRIFPKERKNEAKNGFLLRGMFFRVAIIPNFAR